MANAKDPKTTSSSTGTGTAQATTAATPAGTAAPLAVRLGQRLGIFQQGRTFLRQLRGLFGATALDEAARNDLKRRWNSFVPELARAAADTLDDGIRFFPNLPFGGGDSLRDKEEEVREFGAFVAEVTLFASDMNDEYTRRKAALAEDTYLVVNTVKGLLALPLFPGQDKQDLEEATRNLLDVDKQQVQATLDTRRQNEQLRTSQDDLLAELKAELERVKAENAVLRGQALPADTGKTATARTAHANKRAGRGQRRGGRGRRGTKTGNPGSMPAR